MATVIYTGDKAKCRTVITMECPICSCSFENKLGRFVMSDTVGDRVLVCPAHKGKKITAAEEVSIQDALQKAINQERGHVARNNTVVKKSALVKKYEKVI